MSQYPPPPPPPGGYGSPPPPPPPPSGGYGGYGGGYGGPPVPSSTPWDLATAFTYGWAKFQANVAQILLAALALVLAVGLVGVVMVLVVVAAVDSFLLGLVALGLTIGVVLVVAQLIGAGLIRAALDVTEGRPFETSRVFAFENVGNVLLTSLLVGAITGVGYVLCYVPGLVAMFLLSYAMYFVVDKNLAPLDAIRASYELTTQNLGNTVLWYVVSSLVASAGALVCGVGALVTVPLVLIGTAWTYKKLTGQEVAP